MVSKSEHKTKSLACGLEILILLVEAGRPMGVTEIAQTLGIARTTAFRMLSTLAGRGFAVQDRESRRYGPGLRIIELSRQVLDRIDLRSVAKPWLKRLEEATGESVHLAMPIRGLAVYVAVEESPADLTVKVPLGSGVRVHSTAIGKALIAHLSREELDSVLGHGQLPRFTPRTITTMQELIPHLELIRTRGYAVDDQEYTLGVRCAAASIHDHRGKVIAAVAVSGPSVRVSLQRIPELGTLVMETADEISRLMGYQPEK